MNYRYDKYGNPLSVLGFGCMRFPFKHGSIDMEKTEKLIMRAIDGGINYFDTAYIYPGSEAALGEILEKNNARDRVNITTKLPHYLLKSRDTAEKLFNEELRRLRTDHVDYYLLHMLTDVVTWEGLQKIGIEEWLLEKKASGQIRQIGFSYHGGSENFCRLVDAFDWDMCMIQYNYMDEHSQAGRRGLDYANAKGLPVMIMEPLRGGRLVSHLPKNALDIFERYPIRHTPAQWALKWLWDQEKVTVVLSGMNSLEMLEDNISTASSTQAGEFTDNEQEMLRSVAEAINFNMKVGCTGCGYCLPCPKGVDIPGAFSAYNRRFSEGKFSALKDHFMCSALRPTPTSASRCIGCGKCEQHCPQGIAIRTELKAVEKELEGPLYRTALKLAKKFVRF